MAARIDATTPPVSPVIYLQISKVSATPAEFVNGPLDILGRCVLVSRTETGQSGQKGDGSGSESLEPLGSEQLPGGLSLRSGRSGKEGGPQCLDGSAHGRHTGGACRADAEAQAP